MPEQTITALVAEGETVVQQDPQGNWAIITKPNTQGQFLRTKMPTGIQEQPLAEAVPSATAPQAGIAPAMPTAVPGTATGALGMSKVQQEIVEGEMAIGLAASAASLLQGFFKKN